jgi:hypothetical protein
MQNNAHSKIGHKMSHDQTYRQRIIDIITNHGAPMHIVELRSHFMPTRSCIESVSSALKAMKDCGHGEG